MNMQFTGGQMQFSNLTTKLHEIDKKEYERIKATFWFYMLKEGKEPIKWLKPNKSGTKVNFEMLQDEASFKMALGILEAHFSYVNEVYGLDLEIENKTKK